MCCLNAKMNKEEEERKRKVFVYRTGGALIKKSDCMKNLCVCVLLNNCPGLGL